jgi:hypothetical protein
MSDDPEIDLEITEAEQETSYAIHDGDLLVMDPEYLDRTCEAQGVLAIQHSIERGSWVLIGRGGDGEPYTQVWERIGDEPSTAKRLRPVS